MATIEELDELSVEIINGVNGEEESASSPTRAQKTESKPTDASAVVSTSAQALEDEDSDDEDDYDETVLERLIGLTEMFPNCVQTAASKLFYGSISSVKGIYSFGRSASWILFSTSAILVAPIIFELERAQMEEMQRQQQRQILLGPGAAMSGGSPHPGMGLAPSPPR